MSASSVRGPAPNLDEFLNAPPAPPAAPPSAPGLFSRLASGVQHYAFTPVRGATEEAAQGLANRLSELFANNQQEITRRVQGVFTQALVGRCPQNYVRLKESIHTFLMNPHAREWDEIRTLSPALQAGEIRFLLPSINDNGVQILTTLHTLAYRTNPDTGSVQIGENTRQVLETAEALLQQVVQSNEGALLQTLDQLTASLRSAQGPIATLRDQMNHPEHGIIAESLAALRRDLNGRVPPPLRQSKEAIHAYRQALQRNASAAELMPLRQTLHEKLQLLLGARAQVPSITRDHWAVLEQFDAALAAALPADLAPLLAQSDVAQQILDAAFTRQRGILEEASDIIVEGIGRGVMHLETLPSRMAQRLFSGQAAGPQAAGQPAFFDFGSIAEQGRRIFNSLMSFAGTALSQQGAKSLATLLLFTFEKVQDHLRESQDQPHLLQRIVPMVQRLRNAAQQSSWAESTAVLQEAFQFMQQQQTYFQGLRLPLNPVRTNVSSIPGFLQNINAHQNILQPPSQRIPQRVTEAMVKQKAETLKARISSLGPAKLALEKICGIAATDAMWAEIYREGGGSDFPAILRQRIFDKIDLADTGFFAPLLKWTAKRVYDLGLSLSSFYINAIMGGMLGQIISGIKDSSFPQEKREEFFIKLLRNWLAVTSGAYNQVAAAPSAQARDFNLMMEEAITNPERNGGLRTDELIAASLKTILDTFGPKVAWSETVTRAFNLQFPSDSMLSFLNPLVIGLNVFCSFTLQVLLFIPQWLANQTLQIGSKIALSNSHLFKEFSEKQIESLRRNTPMSYQMHRLIYRQLQKILVLLQQSFNDEEDASGILTRNTNIKKLEIENLVEYLLEVLNKSQYRTQDRLNNYLQHRAPLRDRAGRELDETFLPEVMETVVMTISFVLNSVSQEEEMQQMLYDTLCIFNGSFDANPPVSEEEFATVEKGIRELIDQLIETAIFHAIDDEFDFANEKQKRGIAHFIQTWKDQTQTFAIQMQQLAAPVLRNGISASELVTKTTAMIEWCSQYHHQRVDALGKADGNRNFHTETKYHLNELSRHLLTLCTPITEELNRMKGIAEEVLSNEKILAPLRLCSQVNQILAADLARPEPCLARLPLLQRHLAELQNAGCPLPLTEEVQRTIREYASSLAKINEMKKTEEAMRKAFVLFRMLQAEKIAHLGKPPSTLLIRSERQLCDLLDTLHRSAGGDRLRRQVLQLMIAQTPEEASAAAQEFYHFHVHIAARSVAEETRQKQHLVQTNAALTDALQQSIQEYTTSIAASREAVHRHCRDVSRQTTELNQWVQDQHEQHIWNLFIFDMEWVTETVKNLAFDRAQAKMKQLFASIYHRHNYFGIINQAALLPFLEKFGKHHLRA